MVGNAGVPVSVVLATMLPRSIRRCRRWWIYPDISAAIGSSSTSTIRSGSSAITATIGPRWAIWGVSVLTFWSAPLFGLEPAVKLIVLAIPPLTAAGFLWVARWKPLARIRRPASLSRCRSSTAFRSCSASVNFALSVALAFLAFGLWLRLGRLGRTTFCANGCSCRLDHHFLLPHLRLGFARLDVLFGRRGSPSRPRPVMVPCRLRGRSPHLRHGTAARRSCCCGRSRAHGSIAAGHGLTGEEMAWATPRCATVGIFDVASLAWSRWCSCRGGQPRADVGAQPRVRRSGCRPPHSSSPRKSSLPLMRTCVSPVPVRGRFARIGLRRPSRRASAICSPPLGWLFRGAAWRDTASLAIAAKDQSGKAEGARLHSSGARVASFYGLPEAEPWALQRNSHLGALVIVRRGGFSNDQWITTSHNLLELRYREPGSFASDPSEVVRPDGTASDRRYRTIDEALAQVPRDKFDFIWLINVRPRDQRPGPDLQPVWRGPGRHSVPDSQADPPC